MEEAIIALRDALNAFNPYAGKACRMPPEGAVKMEEMKRAYLALHAANGWTGSAVSWRICASLSVQKQVHRFLKQQAEMHGLSDLLRQ